MCAFLHAPETVSVTGIRLYSLLGGMSGTLSASKGYANLTRADLRAPSNWLIKLSPKVPRILRPRKERNQTVTCIVLGVRKKRT